MYKVCGRWCVGLASKAMSVNEGLLIVLLSCLVYFLNIGGYSISILDEAKNATCAMEMKQHGEPFFPTFNGEIRTDKPPLHYYFMSLSYSIFGYTELGARFFSGLMGVLTVLMVFWSTTRLLTKRAGWYASLILLASIHCAIEFQLAVPDPYLIFFLSAGIFFFVLHQVHRRLIYALAIYASLALAVLSKGPVAVGIPGLIFLIYLIVSKSLTWSNMVSLQVLPGILIFCAIVLPVFYQLHIATDGVWTNGFFFDHNIGRFSSTMEGHDGSILYIPLVVLVGLLPFSFFFPQALAMAFRDRQNALLLVCLITTAVFVLFFTISRTKLPNYPMPGYPFIAVLLGYYLDRLDLGMASLRHFKISLYVAAMLLVLLPLAIYLMLKGDGDLQEVTFLWVWFLPLAVAALLSVVLLKKGVRMAIFSMIVGFILFNAGVRLVILPELDARLPTVAGRDHLDRAKQVGYFRSLNPAVPFIVKSSVPKIQDEEIETFLSNPNHVLILKKKHFEDLERLQGLDVLHSGRDPFEKKTWLFVRKAM